jgi:hypothetical protein
LAIPSSGSKNTKFTIFTPESLDIKLAVIFDFSEKFPRRKKTMRAGWVVLIVIIIEIGAALAFMWSGVYDVAADRSDWGPVSWYVKNVRERSIDLRSEDLSAPSSIEPGLIQNASYYYYGTCKICHGAPGDPPDKFSQGLDPIPPHMGLPTWDMPTDGEMFWIIKHGIKMTGMASFDKVFEKNDQKWAMVAFLKEMHKKAQKTR